MAAAGRMGEKARCRGAPGVSLGCDHQGSRCSAHSPGTPRLGALPARSRCPRPQLHLPPPLAGGRGAHALLLAGVGRALLPGAPGARMPGWLAGGASPSSAAADWAAPLGACACRCLWPALELPTGPSSSAPPCRALTRSAICPPLAAPGVPGRCRAGRAGHHPLLHRLRVRAPCPPAHQRTRWLLRLAAAGKRCSAAQPATEPRWGRRCQACSGPCLPRMHACHRPGCPAPPRTQRRLALPDARHAQRGGQRLAPRLFGWAPGWAGWRANEPRAGWRANEPAASLTRGSASAGGPCPTACSLSLSLAPAIPPPRQRSSTACSRTCATSRRACLRTSRVGMERATRAGRLAGRQQHGSLGATWGEGWRPACLEARTSWGSRGSRGSPGGLLVGWRASYHRSTMRHLHWRPHPPCTLAHARPGASSHRIHSRAVHRGALCRLPVARACRLLCDPQTLWRSGGTGWLRSWRRRRPAPLLPFLSPPLRQQPLRRPLAAALKAAWVAPVAARAAAPAPLPARLSCGRRRRPRCCTATPLASPLCARPRWVGWVAAACSVSALGLAHSSRELLSAAAPPLAFSPLPTHPATHTHHHSIAVSPPARCCRTWWRA